MDEEQQGADNHDGREGLDQRTHEGNQNTALQFILGGKQPARNHGLAVTWACRMKHAIKKAQHQKRPGSGAGG